MPLTLAPLPYADDALAPHVSAQTLQFHHGKHHKAYVDKTNAAIAGTPLADKALPEIVAAALAAGDKALFNSAAQAWNHDFLWHSMAPGGGGATTGKLAAAITRDFGSHDGFAEAFTKAATGHFGSGWVWLVRDGDKLAITTTPDADTPLVHGQTALLTLDVWEHAYYLDYQNARPGYVAAFLAALANWDFAAANFSAA
ncbi:MAG: superoxide dismutase [Polymorphobacter sp.]